MDVHSLQQYLQSRFTGRDDFMQNIIEPIFAGFSFEEGWNTEMLEDDELLTLAKQTGVTSVLHYGYIELPRNATHIFEVTVADRIQVNRNRVGMQRLVRRLMSGQNHQSAFMIFHYADQWQLDWRFSYCHYGDKDMTTAKRYTFLLGPGQACRTAAQNFCKLFERRGELTPDDITAAFDVEALSKEFFNKYKEHYERFCEYIYNNKENPELFGEEFATWEDKTIRDYVKKLLGRIVFLHFLQKKGWMGVPADKPWGEGDRQFMKSLFDKATDSQKANYLDEVLEPLFADALDVDRKANDDLFDCGVEGFRNVKFPYLNGGLFERDRMDESKSIFSQELFADLFNFLSQYNFTIDENDPDDAEVGVDPEMLGRIFENLLEDNKDKGAFYTPKEIVQYMCRESLIAYLTTYSIGHGNKNPRERVEKALRDMVNTPDKIVPRMTPENKEVFGQALRSVKICDPAIGSGAFPMGLLNELVRCRVSISAWALDKEGRLLVDDYAALKREIISNNVYGVDIERGAIDIARLRFWLSIVVDEKMPHTLPNLDYKFMQGNSLITTFDGEYVNLDTKGQKHIKVGEMVKDKKGLYSLKQQYYKATGEDKHRLSILIKDTILRLVSRQIGFEMRSWVRKNANGNFLPFDDVESVSFKDIKQALPADKLRIIKLAESLHKRLNDTTIPLAERALTDIHFFDWRIMFTEVFEGDKPGFDIVIGNPPYIQLQKDGGILAELYKNCGFETFDRMGDIYSLFYEHGNNLLREGGVLCYITSNKWMRTGYGEKTRSFFKNKVSPRILLDLVRMKLFDDATVETNIMLFMKKPYEIPTKCASLVELKKEDLLRLNSLIEEESYTNRFDTSEFWTLSDAATGNLKSKIKLSGMPLKTWNLKINFGVKTGFNDAFIISTEKKEEILLACKTKEERERTEAIIRPVIRGKDVGVYKNNWAGLWLICTFPAKKYDIDTYPALKAYLLSFGKERLEQSGKKYGTFSARKKTKNDWFETQDSIAYWKDLDKPKIIWKRIGSILRFAYDDEKSMCLDSTCFATGEHVKFLCAIFNSKLGHFMLQDSSKTGTGDLLISVQAIEPIVVPFPSEDSKREIESLVDRILSAKKLDPQADITNLEREIDRLVYDLYGLTEDEIAIVEGTNR